MCGSTINERKNINNMGATWSQEANGSRRPGCVFFPGLGDLQQMETRGTRAERLCLPGVLGVAPAELSGCHTLRCVGAV